ncbi:large conductance mechanosensitive channel [Sporobacter termitidis DSM 10068]|uniref:Large-conductance mechanosensitive channel n=1 Tax=Sporobacter termitidis DSM 10068 TaxID=1123282 RepID=A0A1M5VUW7_9FIRM|nr:large-conductance mechanosensitive channel protein MscL [Sporobacter termitidis]SHH79045.1 large conductance mechanosensitive channel [Sporobacter termitidis DSM 10068]
MKRLAAEFKTFAVKGNVIDLAVGVIIGAAFSKIVSSLVTDIAMPVIGMFTGGVNFSKWTIELPRFFGQTEVINFNIGNFINTVVEFVILAFIVFLFVKAINRLKKKQEEAPPAPVVPTREELLLAEICDLLKAQNEKKDK